MKLATSFAALTTAVFTVASGQTLLFQDTFDTADTTDLDSAPLTGRLSGLASGETWLASHGPAQAISSNQLSPRTTGYPGGGVRFGGATSRYDWAGTTTGADIVAAQGFVVSFDWTHDGTNGEWLAFKVGTANSDAFVNDASVDHAILIRGTGANERWDNGSGRGNSGISYGPVGGVQTTYPVKLTYTFDSFADDANVNLVAVVNGVEIVNDNFTWSGNGGALHMDLHTYANGFLVDNFKVTTSAPPAYQVSLDDANFDSGAIVGDPVGKLSGMLGLSPAASSFTLVPGDGDDDNALFAIDGSQLVVNSDFTGGNSVDGQQFSVRVRGTSTEGGGETGEAAFLLTVTKNDDLDDLPDAWELRWAPDLATLDGAGYGDADLDNLYDIEEYQLSLGTFPGRPAYPDIDPTNPDSDGDGVLSDGDEVFPAGPRPPTDPTSLDTDDDHLGDVAETNTGVFVDADDTGTNPTDPDWDGDGARDGWELLYLSGAAIYDAAAFPPPASPVVTVTRLTDDASSGLSSSKAYTHVISGGGAATVNGVVFDVLTDTATPAGFDWSTHADTKAMVAPITNNGWSPANGGVTGPGLLDLLGGFTWAYTNGIPGSLQTYTLSGLTPGESYVFSLYLRRWDNGGTGRLIDLAFTNGTEVVVPYSALPEDRPGLVLGTGNHDHAYRLSYRYTAQGTELVIDAANDPVFGEPWSSLHLYGLTNEVSDAVVTPQLVITKVTRNAATGAITLDFLGEPSKSYRVTKSPDPGMGFGPLAAPLNPVTNAGGVGQVTVPASEFGGAPKYFLRIED